MYVYVDKKDCQLLPFDYPFTRMYASFPENGTISHRSDRFVEENSPINTNSIIRASNIFGTRSTILVDAICIL